MSVWWIVGFGAALVVVVVVAALLLGILYQARRIRRLAVAASDVVGEIDANTRGIWALAATNRVAGELLDGAREIDDNAATLAATLAGNARGDADAA